MRFTSESDVRFPLRVMVAVLTLLIVPTFVCPSFSGRQCVLEAAKGKDDSLKPLVRAIFGQLSQASSATSTTNLHEGMQLIRFTGCTGLCLEPEKFVIRPEIWTDYEGLMDRFRKAQGRPVPPVAAINGLFYSASGIVGQILVDGKIPPRFQQMHGTKPRCFLAVLKNGDRQRWVIGETTLPLRDFEAEGALGLTRFNRPWKAGETLYQMMHGGGWIIRDGRDVHMESYKKQGFRFRKVDQDSRHTVIAMDRKDRLYLLVFEAGANLEAIVDMLLKRPEFAEISEAIFFDGGSSSTMVLNGEYLVAPLYLLDKARYSALFVTPNIKPVEGAIELPAKP